MLSLQRTQQANGNLLKLHHKPYTFKSTDSYAKMLFLAN